MFGRVVAVVLIAFTGWPLAGPPAIKTCTTQEQRIGTCTVSTTNNTSTLDFEARKSDPGSGGTAPIGTSDPERRTLSDALGRCAVEQRRIEICPANPEAPTIAVPAITLTDLAHFAPDPVAATGEPDNLGVAGMPTNFVAAASAHTRSGALFGVPVTVRFTPVGYDFRYGDGDTASTTTGGQTWSTLGQAAFTPTATSHIYRERGTYDASVIVRYTAEVDLGTGWFPVEGQLSIDGPVQQIRIFEAHTALVARTCTEQPAAPGC